MQSTNTINTPWLSQKEAAAYIGVKYRTLGAWVREGKVKAFVLSGTKRCTYRFTRESLDAILTQPSTAETGELIAR